MENEDRKDDLVSNASAVFGFIASFLLLLLLILCCCHPSNIEDFNFFIEYVPSIIPLYGISVSARYKKTGKLRDWAIFYLCIGGLFFVLYLSIGLAMALQGFLFWGKYLWKIGFELLFSVMTIYGITYYTGYKK